MEKLAFQKDFSSGIYNVKCVVEEIMSFIKICFPLIDDTDYYDLKLVFSELLINAVIHGNHSDCSKNVHLSIEVQEENLLAASIIDEGLGFDYINLIQKINADDFILSESGRGISLVCSLTDGVTFSQKGNEIHFKKRVQARG